MLSYTNAHVLHPARPPLPSLSPSPQLKMLPLFHIWPYRAANHFPCRFFFFPPPSFSSSLLRAKLISSAPCTSCNRTLWHQILLHLTPFIDRANRFSHCRSDSMFVHACVRVCVCVCLLIFTKSYFTRRVCVTNSDNDWITRCHLAENKSNKKKYINKTCLPSCVIYSNIRIRSNIVSVKSVRMSCHFS